METVKGNAQLTNQELDVLKLAAKWMTNGEIASELGVNARAVQGCLTGIIKTLEVGSRTKAVLYVL